MVILRLGCRLHTCFSKSCSDFRTYFFTCRAYYILSPKKKSAVAVVYTKMSLPRHVPALYNCTCISHRENSSASGRRRAPETAGCYRPAQHKVDERRIRPPDNYTSTENRKTNRKSKKIKKNSETCTQSDLECTIGLQSTHHCLYRNACQLPGYLLWMRACCASCNVMCIQYMTLV